MNVIFFGRQMAVPGTSNLAHPVAIAATRSGSVWRCSAALLGRPRSSASATLRGNLMPRRREWSRKLAAQQAQIAETRRVLQEHVDALAKRVGQMNAHVIRLDALGQRLTQMANIDEREFDFRNRAGAGRTRDRHAGPGRADPGAHGDDR